MYAGRIHLYQVSTPRGILHLFFVHPETVSLPVSRPAEEQNGIYRGARDYPVIP